MNDKLNTLGRLRVARQLIEITEDSSKGEHSGEIQWTFRIPPTKHDSEYSTHLPGLQTKVLTSYRQPSFSQNVGRFGT